MFIKLCFSLSLLSRSGRRQSREAFDRNVPAAFGHGRQAGRGEEEAVRGDGPEEEGTSGNGEKEGRRGIEKEVKRKNILG